MTSPDPSPPDPNASRGAGGRIASLDVLRFVAVALVFARHVNPALVDWPPAAAAVMRVWNRAGWAGVDLFFVLSGFLVSGLLFRERREHGSISVGRFLVRRGFKIYPAFYVFLAATVVSRLFVGSGKEIPLVPFLSELFFFQNYGGGLWWHTWSLAVEEHFYILCAALMFVLARRGAARADPFASVPAISAIVVVVSLALRVVTSHSLPYRNETHLYPTHLRLDGLGLGVGLSYLYHYHRAAAQRLVLGRRLAFTAAGLALMAPAFIWDLAPSTFMHTAGITLVDLGAGCLVLALVVNGLPETAPVRALAWVGSFSYSIYLWHVPVLFETERLFRSVLRADPRSPAAVAVYMTASVLVGVLMAKLVEMPALRLRDRWFPSASRGAPAQAAPRRVS